MEIKNEIMGVEKLLVFCGSRFFSWSNSIQAFYIRVFDDEKTLKKTSKLEQIPKTQQFKSI
jgi:hypothetical protein